MWISYIFLLFIVCVECKAPDGYTTNTSLKRAYKLMYTAEPWNTARDKCIEDGAKLAVPKSEDEFAYIQSVVRGMHYPSIVGSDYKLLVWLGIDNQENNTIWRNVDGEDIKNTGYSKWASQNGQIYSAEPNQPHCVGIDAANDGLRDFWCNNKQPYLCEIKTS